MARFAFVISNRQTARQICSPVSIRRQIKWEQQLAIADALMVAEAGVDAIEMAKLSREVRAFLNPLGIDFQVGGVFSKAAADRKAAYQEDRMA